MQERTRHRPADANKSAGLLSARMSFSGFFGEESRLANALLKTHATDWAVTTEGSPPMA